ncbi:MAG: hypothetical protein CMO01_27060 [Thalassobius sp.]|nr:hypothetical protein [Thalassovita sp.]
MMQLNQTSKHNSYLFLTQQYVIGEYARKQMLFDTFKVFIAIFFAMYASSLHAYTITTKTHEVQSGETLWGIANANNVTVEEIVRANSIQNNLIVPGQKIAIPVKNTNTYTQQNTTTNSSTVATQNTSNYNNRKHVVRAGETLYGIAKNARVSEQDIIRVNNLRNSALYIGQELSLPESNQNYYNTSYDNRTDKLTGFRNDFMSYAKLQEIKIAKNDFQVLQSGINSYDLFENNRYIATVKDNVPSKYAVRKDGVQYNNGTKIDYNYIKRLGYDDATALALSFVSSNEGSASALNFYDGAGSFGFIQFTIKYGSFAKFVSLLKDNDYIAYTNYLVKYGIVLENGNLVVYAPEGYKGQTRLTGELVIDYIIKTKSLYGPLIKLGESTKAVQVESAREQYMSPALNIQLNLKGKSVRASEVFYSAIGVAALTDLAVKLGVSGAKKEIETALNNYISRTSNSYYAVKSISNYQLIKIIASSSDNYLVKRRMNKLLSQFGTHQLLSA